MRIEEIAREVTNRIYDRKLGLEAIAVYADGRNVFTTHLGIDKARNTHSHTKSVLSLAVGASIEDGYITLETDIADTFPEYITKENEEILSKIKLRHLLTMSSGFGKPLLMRKERRMGIGSPDYIAYMSRMPLTNIPGQKFTYSTADSILAGRMLEKSLDMPLDVYIQSKIFAPLGIDMPEWERCPQGHVLGGGGMYLSIDDMLKLGELVLYRGNWMGRQLISSAWIEEATSKQIDIVGFQPYPSFSGYGYYFWTVENLKACCAHGVSGQNTLIFPDKSIVISIQCAENSNDADIMAELINMLNDC